MKFNTLLVFAIITITATSAYRPDISVNHILALGNSRRNSPRNAIQQGMPILQENMRIQQGMPMPIRLTVAAVQELERLIPPAPQVMHDDQVAPPQNLSCLHNEWRCLIQNPCLCGCGGYLDACPLSICRPHDDWPSPCCIGTSVMGVMAATIATLMHYKILKQE